MKLLKLLPITTSKPTIITPIKSTTLLAKDFISAAQKLHCIPYTPVDRLSGALENYNILEIWADGRGRNAFNDSSVISTFIIGQRMELGLKENLEKSLEGKGLLIFTHEDGILSIISNRDAFQQLKELDPDKRLTPAEELAEVIDSETKRDSQNPGRPSLDDIEGNIISADNNMLLAQTISGEDYAEEQPDLILKDRATSKK